MRDEQFRDVVLFVEHAHHQRFFDLVKSTIGQRGCRGHTQRLSGEASFAEELTGTQNGDDRFLALLGGHRELHLAFLEIPHGIRSVSLHEDGAARAVFQNGFPACESREECCPIDGLSLSVCWCKRGLVFAVGLFDLSRALLFLWRHNNLSFLLAS